MKGQKKKILAGVAVVVLGALVITAVFLRFFTSEPRRYPLESEIYAPKGYTDKSELTTKVIFLNEGNEIIFHYMMRDTITLADTGKFSYNEKTGFLSTSEWKKQYPFKDGRIRIFNDPDPVIRIGKSQFNWVQD